MSKATAADSGAVMKFDFHQDEMLTASYLCTNWIAARTTTLAVHISVLFDVQSVQSIASLAVHISVLFHVQYSLALVCRIGSTMVEMPLPSSRSWPTLA